LADKPSSVAQVKWLTMAFFLADLFTIVFSFGGRLPLLTHLVLSHKIIKNIKNMSNCNTF